MTIQLLLIGIFTLLLQISFCIHLSNEQQDDQKVKIDFYYQTICPHSKHFILGPLKQAAKTKDFWKICEINLYPWGNANRRKRDNSWEIICQHGLDECKGNLINTCALKFYDKYTQVIPFIICIEQGAPSWQKYGQSCAKQNGLDWAKINDCSVSQTGFQYQMEMGDATEALNPPRTEAPWFVVNGKHTETINDELQDGLVKYVCQNYKGSIKIDACK